MGHPGWEVGLNGQETALEGPLEERWLGSAWEGKGTVRYPWSFLVCVADRMSPDRGNTELIGKSEPTFDCGMSDWNLTASGHRG